MKPYRLLFALSFLLGVACSTPTSRTGPTPTPGDDDDDNGTPTPTSTSLPADPTAAGPFSWTTDSAQISSLDDTIPLAIYRPDGSGPFPVVVLSHGFLLGAGDYASYGEHLASWGFIAVLPDYPGTALSPETHADLATHLMHIMDWIEGPDGPEGADPARIGLSGHSAGGKFSLLAAANDPRPVASFTIDPVDAAPPLGGNPIDYPSVTPELMSDLSIPLGFVGETVNATSNNGQACAPEDENFHQYFANADTPAIEIEILGANHMSFLDDPDCGFVCSACPKGNDDPTQTRALTRKYLTAFYNVYLRDLPEYRVYLTGAPMTDDIATGLVKSNTTNGF